MSEPYEMELRATNSKGETASYPFEYTTKPNDASSPQQAVDDIIQSISPGVASRMKSVGSSR